MADGDNLPDHLLKYSYGGVADDIMSGLGVNAPPYISIKGNRFTLIDAGGTKIPVQTFDPNYGVYLDVIILAANKNVSRIYYEKDFDPGAIDYQPPDCWSDNGVAPSVNASNPQHPSCSTCPKAEWGSGGVGLSGRGVPACSQYKKLACLLADGSVAGDVVFLLRVPPNTIRPLRTYIQKIAQHRKGDRPLDTTDIVTRLYFDVGAQGNQLGTLGFRAMNYLDDETRQLVGQLAQETAAIDNLLGRNDRPRTAALPNQYTSPANVVPLQQPAAIPPPPVQAPVRAPQQAPAAPQQEAPLAEAPKRGRGRPKKNGGAVAPAPAPPAAQTAPRAPFEQGQANPAPAPAPAAQHGIAMGGAPAPDAAISQQLSELFSRPTGKG